MFYLSLLNKEKLKLIILLNIIKQRKIKINNF